MSDESFYSPTYKPPPPRVPKPKEPLWTLWVAGVTWSCELRFHSESYGWEALSLDCS